MDIYETLDKAINHLNQKEYSEAISVFELIVKEENVPEAMDYIGYMYAKGLEVERNPVKAIEIYIKSSKTYSDGMWSNCELVTPLIHEYDDGPGYDLEYLSELFKDIPREMQIKIFDMLHQAGSYPIL